MNAKKRGLGKGLDALLGTSAIARTKEQTADDLVQPVARVDNEFKKLPIEWLYPGKYQPRKDMARDALDELAASITAQGIIQPIVVRELNSQQFEIIAGERRWRAAQLAGLTKVPCIVKNVADEAVMAMSLIENIQREDLNAMEESIALLRLIEEFSLTHQQVADAVGKSRASVSNLLRLNSLNTEVKILLEHGDIEMGHARALLALEGELQSQAASNIAQRGLTVRDTEKLVRKLLEPKTEISPIKVKDPDVVNLEYRLSERLKAKVIIKQGANGCGKLTIDYTSLAELDDIVATLG
ncbi:ParB/RepB/Spo0J family partition protein [Moritella viscosa]|uniref:Probable chromosome-partitioning protein ParB n=1 Tax=Moritella viscosa TaxID=80854 RepID=A0A090I8S5_9GAMM|nr:ParB/RepB/Spo0J family partition protein [Moritella viscosa]CED58046.1 putative chromosome partitioning protein ParB [Moritella viscosa]SGY93494.1 ParB family protein [Moritella viscosa]SGY98206.1 ParB family protein [Moritella viscosa]SGY98601.1 ParB family protein [Moritella viscosa]SGZ04539.1 ParB family protein [Moritella viscosa]